MLTGESLPVDKQAGEMVFGATINKFGTFKMQATRVGKETALARIIKMVEDAQGSKAPIQKIADQVAGIFVPAVVGVATLTFIIWYLLGRHKPGVNKRSSRAGYSLPMCFGTGYSHGHNGGHRQRCRAWYPY